MPSLSALLLTVSATVGAPGPVPAPTPATPLIEYRRTGGIVGVDDRVGIEASGAVTVRDRRGGVVTGQLAPSELGELKQLFSGWRQLGPSHRTPSVAADAFVYEIRFQGVTVRVDESDDDIPQQFERVRTRIEAIAQGVRNASRTVQ